MSPLLEQEAERQKTSYYCSKLSQILPLLLRSQLSWGGIYPYQAEQLIQKKDGNSLSSEGGIPELAYIKSC